MYELVVFGGDKDVDAEQREDDHVEAAIQQKCDFAVILRRALDNFGPHDHEHELQEEECESHDKSTVLHVCFLLIRRDSEQRKLLCLFFAKATR